MATLLALATGLSQTTLTPKLQARFGATTANLGKVQDSVIYDPEMLASKQIGFVAGDYPEEYRNISMFRLDDTGLTSSRVARASLELVTTHQLGARTSRIAVAQLLPIGVGSDYDFNNYNMYQEPDGDVLVSEGGWTDHHSIDITGLLKSALDQADETRGIVFRVWLASEEAEDLVDYPNQEILKSSLGTVDLKIEVQTTP